MEGNGKGTEEDIKESILDVNDVEEVNEVQQRVRERFEKFQDEKNNIELSIEALYDRIFDGKQYSPAELKNSEDIVKKRIESIIGEYSEKDFYVFDFEKANKNVLNAEVIKTGTLEKLTYRILSMDQKTQDKFLSFLERRYISIDRTSLARKVIENEELLISKEAEKYHNLESKVEQDKDYLSDERKMILNKLWDCKVLVERSVGELDEYKKKIVRKQEEIDAAYEMEKDPNFISDLNKEKRELVDEVAAGNIVGIGGLKNAFPGETISQNPITPFEQMKHIFDPVITKAIEAKKPSDLPKLVEVLMQIQKEDPNIVVQINQETGEHLISGMGELHLEVIENRIIKDKGVEIKTSPPIVVYRETVTKTTPQAVEGKSPNKHNKFYIRVEPLPDSIYQALHEADFPDMRIKKNMPELWEKLEEAGMDKQETRKVKAVYKGNLFIDNTRGIVHLGEVIELILDMFEDVMSKGPLAREPCIKVKVILDDVVLHEDAIHRGPSQVYPAVRQAIRGAFLQSNPMLLEPVQTLLFEAPIDYMGAITKLVSSKRGQLLEMNQDEVNAEIKAKIPVAEMFGISSELRSATGGRGTFFLVDQEFQPLPSDMQSKIIEQIRNRKGLKSFKEEWGGE